MLGNIIALNGYHFASTYGDGAYNSQTYNGNTTTEQGTTTVPGAPNTGFFNSVVSGQNNMVLIPAILVIAVLAGAIAIGVRKFIRSRRS